MRRALSAGVTFLMSLAAVAAAGEIVPSGKRVLALSPETERIFTDVFVHSITGMRDRELAAFIVEQTDGTLGCLLWPSHARSRTESFRGIVPAGTVAVVHSHPDGMSGRPSRGDAEIARQLDLPFIVVSRTEIWIAGARGGAPVNLTLGFLWAKAGDHDCVCRNPDPPPVPKRWPAAKLARGEKEP